MIEIGFTVEHLLLLIVSILPVFYKYSFWFYTIQLKEYRLDRFKEYIFTPQGKSALFNIWSVIELPLFFIGFIIFFDRAFEIINYNVLFYFLLIYNLFVIGKILRKRFIKPKLTGRLLMLLILFLFGGSIDLYFLIFGGYIKWIYVYIPFVLVFSPLIIFFYIFISSFIVNYFKNKKINTAIKKSLENDYPIKIGITGSYGKSSVKEYLSNILEQEGKILKTPENINTELGVSDLIIKKLNNTYKYFIAEMGAYRIGEIKTLGSIVNHKFGFLTAIGNQHLGLFGSIENTKKAKIEIQNKILEKGGILYINWENENIRKSNFNKNLNIVKYGLNKEADAYSKITGIKDGITSFTFYYKEKNYNFNTNLLGNHNIINLSGILAFCIDREIEYKNLLKYLINLKVPKNTLEIIKKDNLIQIDDSHNLSEEGLYAGIEVLNSFQGKKILVLDDILELGNESQKIHFEIGKKIAKENTINQILFCGINYKKDFINGLLEGGFKKENIITEIKNKKENTVILFEGKKSGKYIIK